VHVSKPIVAALKTVGQVLMVDAEDAQQCRIEVVDMYRVFDDVVAELVGRPTNGLS
jgi:hypothetical protein